MHYICSPCDKKSLRTVYSMMFFGIVLMIFGILMLPMGYDILIALIIELSGIVFVLGMGIPSIRAYKRGMKIPEEDFKEATVGNVDIKGMSYISYPYNKKE